MTTPGTPSPYGDFGTELLATLAAAHPDATITHTTTLPATQAEYSPWPGWVSADLRATLDTLGVKQLWTHQARTACALRDGRHTVIATGTSSGKSLGYQLPILTRLADTPTACALYITPTKALAGDQLSHASWLIRSTDGLKNITLASYDGDTPTGARRAIRDHAQWVFTNPDMLHLSLLGGHQRWGRLLRNLHYIVIDESHAYRGLFGAHTSWVLRRLIRLARAYGSSPTVVLASATSADPVGHASLLTGIPAHDFVGVTRDTAPTGARTVALVEPGASTHTQGSHNELHLRKAATTVGAEWMATLVAEGARTLTFVRSRRSAENVAAATAELLEKAGRPQDAARIASYRAGYLADERRALEKALDDGSLLGVATTNALELGVDIGGLDAVVTCGYPGTIASFWQQAGRAGRRGQHSLVTFIARDEPLDTYLVHHPEALLGTPVEKTVFDPHNPYVALQHVFAAALEKPLTPAEVAAWGIEDTVSQLVDSRLLRPRGSAGVLYPQDAPGAPTHHSINVRGEDGGEVAIVERESGQLIGTISAAKAPSETHTGALYIHRGTSFVVDELDLGQAVAWVRRDTPPWTTWAREDIDIRIESTRGTQQIAAGIWRAHLDVTVTTRIMDYTRKLPDGTVLDVTPLDMPPAVLPTQAVAYTLEPHILRSWGLEEADWPGALHAAEHAAIGLLPLIATCDRWDIGGVSTALHPDTGLPTVFVYDGYPGGAGFAAAGYQEFAAWIGATAAAVAACSCQDGCPSCVQSPKCGNGNEPLSKKGALAILQGLHAHLRA